MKRILSLLLTVMMLFTGLCVFGEAKTVKVKAYESVSTGADCEISDTYYTAGTQGFCDVSGKEPTDGVLGGSPGGSAYGTEWICFHSSKAQKHWINIDLGVVKSGLKACDLDLRYDGEGVVFPKKVEYFISENGKDFTSLGTGTVAEKENGNYNALWVSDKEFSGRYFRVEITSGGPLCLVSEFMVCREVEREVDIPEEDTSIRFIGTAPFRRTDDGLILGVRRALTSEDFGRYLPEGYGGEYKILTPAGKERTSGYVSTGDILTRTVRGTETDRVTLIVTGDVNSDGLVNSSDYLLIKRHYLSTYTLKGNALIAATASNGKTVTAIDYMYVKRTALDTYDISTIYAPADPVYDTDMTFKKESDSLFRMTTTYKGKKVDLTFDRKTPLTTGSTDPKNTWNMWNIGTFTYDGVYIAGGGTDWEYVFMAAGSNGGTTVWSGGNHGCETHLSLAVYDKEGNLHDMKVGDSFTSKAIKIVEKSRLHLGNEDNYYCEVTRTYHLAGNRISLDTDFHYVKDVWMTRAYTCMFPIYKPHGLNHTFYNVDGSEKSGTTVPTADWLSKYKTEFTGANIGGNKALKVGFRSEQYSNWVFDVEVKTPYDSVNNFVDNAQATMLWDMCSWQDKLYFNKFTQGKYNKVSAGHNDGTRSEWTFRVE